MTIAQVVSLLGGVALFLFGMTTMGDGLKRVAGNRLELILYRLSGTPLRGLLLGTGVTAVIQSSCATSVMVVGFVNSGMMKVRQSVSVILGAILGTSVTGWVICLGYIEGAGGLKSLLSTATLTGVVAVVGIILRMFSKSMFKRHLGDILMGFSVLMFGMSAMSAAVSPLGSASWFTAILSTLSNPLLGILVGTLFTAVLQSASAAVGIVQALAVTGVMGVAEALPLLMGVAIGASAPVLLSAIGAGADGKRTALVYPVASVLGVGVLAAVFYPLHAAFSFQFMRLTVSPFSVAAVNSVLRIAMTALLMPFHGGLAAFVSKLVKETEQPLQEGPALRLEERFLSHPALAVEQVRMAISEMAKLARKSVGKALKLINDYSDEGCAAVVSMENAADVYEDKLSAYLMKLTQTELTKRQNAAVAKDLRTLTDLERISDHALNISSSAAELHEKQLRFSPQAAADLDVICAALNEILHIAVRAFETDDLAMAQNVEPLEQRIDELIDEMKRRHVERLQNGECTIAQGFVFNDLLTNFERVSDHCSNVALAVIELHDSTVEAHGYLQALRAGDDADFRTAYGEYAERYALKD